MIKEFLKVRVPVVCGVFDRRRDQLYSDKLAHKEAIKLLCNYLCGYTNAARYVGFFLLSFLFRRNALKICAIFSGAVTLLAMRGINHSDFMTHPAYESFSSFPKPKPGMLGLFLLSSCWSKAAPECGQICQLQHFDLSLWSR